MILSKTSKQILQKRRNERDKYHGTYFHENGSPGRVIFKHNTIDHKNYPEVREDFRKYCEHLERKGYNDDIHLFVPNLEKIDCSGFVFFLYAENYALEREGELKIRQLRKNTSAKGYIELKKFEISSNKNSSFPIKIPYTRILAHPQKYSRLIKKLF